MKKMMSVMAVTGSLICGNPALANDGMKPGERNLSKVLSCQEENIGRAWTALERIKRNSEIYGESWILEMPARVGAYRVSAMTVEGSRKMGDLMFTFDLPTSVDAAARAMGLDPKDAYGKRETRVYEAYERGQGYGMVKIVKSSPVGAEVKCIYSKL